MKNLILIRHGKSSWETSSRDIDRPLTQKGIKNSHDVAQNCSAFLPSSFILWSSIAKRASETALIFAQNILYPIESIVFKEKLYTFDERQLEKVIKSCNNDYDTIILFGHNDAIINFVNKFGDIFIANFPTSGFILIEFDTDSWEKISNGKIKKIIFPHKLIK